MGALKPEVHDLKCWPQFFPDIVNGTKRFEVRVNDRSYAVGDYLLLREWNPNSKGYTGRAAMTLVTVFLDHDMMPNHALVLIPPGIAVMGIQLLDPEV